MRPAPYLRRGHAKSIAMLLHSVVVAVFAALYLGLAGLAWWIRALVPRLERDETGWFRQGL